MLCYRNLFSMQQDGYYWTEGNSGLKSIYGRFRFGIDIIFLKFFLEKACSKII